MVCWASFLWRKLLAQNPTTEKPQEGRTLGQAVDNMQTSLPEGQWMVVPDCPCHKAQGSLA